MIKELMKKYFNTASAESQEEDVTMIEPTEQAPVLADNTADMSAQLATVTASFADLQEQFATLTANYEAAQAALSASAEAQATLVAQAKAKVMAERTASLSAVMGDVKGPLLAASLESLDDATFDLVLSGYAASFDAESKSEMFTEQGVAADAPAVEVDAVQKLAAKFAAEFNVK